MIWLREFIRDRSRNKTERSDEEAGCLVLCACADCFSAGACETSCAGEAPRNNDVGRSREDSDSGDDCGYPARGWVEGAWAASATEQRFLDGGVFQAARVGGRAEECGDRADDQLQLLSGF